VDVSTSCAGCVFAAFGGEPVRDGDRPEYVRQNGCALGRIEKFKQSGAGVTEHEDALLVKGPLLQRPPVGRVGRQAKQSSRTWPS
jgi:hypothetical protein